MSFSAMAYVLIGTRCHVGLFRRQFTDTAVATIRLKLTEQRRVRARPHLSSACLRPRLRYPSGERRLAAAIGRLI